MVQYTLEQCIFLYDTYVQHYSEPLLLVQGMSMCRETAFSTPSVTCELYTSFQTLLATGILIHQQNLYALCSQRCISHCEVQSCEPLRKVRTSLHMYIEKFSLMFINSLICVFNYIHCTRGSQKLSALLP
jgi:hypothetical protein